VLDQLAAMGARATFFLIGGSAQQHPQLVRRILAEGHSIGSHTHCHSRATRMSADAYVRDAVRGRAMLEDLSGIACPLFRPPHGELTPLSLVKLLRTGMRIMHWTHEPKDFESNSNQQLMNWFQTHRPCRGAVVVLHDACRVTAHHLTEYLTAWRPVVRFCGLTPEGECQ
jgi:peptidoglycan/xylan/chitin deacetylase (PgdA/CDA1 family)